MIRATPYRYVPGISQLWRGLRRVWRRWRHAGTAVHCPVCGGDFSGWLGGAEDGPCPDCGSWTRQKIMILYTARLIGQAAGPLRTLFFAPDWGTTRWLAARPEIRLTTTDLAAPGVDLHLDIMAIDLADASQDLVLCCHVMEHVPKDAPAFRELYRILAPGGHLLVQVPYARERALTDEDPSVTDPAERERRFGQFDHVRTYGRDIVERIAAAGFAVHLHSTWDDLGPETARRYGLFDDALFVCRKPEETA